jgi:DNA mismatch repair ATPase MutS
MKAFLMYRDRDFDLQASLPSNASALIQDLELKTLFDAMARGDKFLDEVAKKAVLSSLTNPEEIAYRQQILRDCLEHSAIVRQIYEIAVVAIESQRKVYRGSYYLGSMLSGAVEGLELFVGNMKRLRRIADEHSGQFRSEGFVRFFAMLTKELDDEYFRVVQDHLEQLKFENGVLISAELGKGNKGTNYVLRKPLDEKKSWIRRILSRGPLTKLQGKSPYSFEIAPRDDSGHEELGNLHDRGINLVANALSQSTDHILNFFQMLLTELAFYMGCLNLREQLLRKGEPTCIPVALGADKPLLSAQGLYDVCLALRLEARVVGNDLTADSKELVIITGANQGGKSTFLRGIGVAHLMMQCGTFVAAERFSANVCRGVFTHFKRKEDPTMKSGKLDEELSRMSEIVNHIGPDCILLCNESFQSTNEREGSEIARQIVRALMDTGIKVFFVTFLFDFAQGIYQQKMDTALFLRAEREIDGKRTFKVIEGEPLSTGYGEDLYKKIFGTADRTEQVAHLDARL